MLKVEVYTEKVYLGYFADIERLTEAEIVKGVCWGTTYIQPSKTVLYIGSVRVLIFL